MPRDEKFARLAAQPHRRFIKTHTPLDGLPVDPARHLHLVARHPLDMAVSLDRQGDDLTGPSYGSSPPARPQPAPASAPAAA